MATVTATTSHDADDSTRRRWRRWVIPGVIAAAALTAAAGWALRDDAEHAAAFDCRADGVVSILPNDGTPPIEACIAAWERGQMIEGVTTAPPLVACLTEAGSVAVIEGVGPADCRTAEMVLWDGAAEYTEVGKAVQAVRLAFYDKGRETGDRCVTATAWREALQQAFGAAGLRWSVSIRPAVENRRCYDVGELRLRSREVTLIAVPGDQSIVCDPRGTC